MTKQDIAVCDAVGKLESLPFWHKLFRTQRWRAAMDLVRVEAEKLAEQYEKQGHYSASYGILLNAASVLAGRFFT